MKTVLHSLRILDNQMGVGHEYLIPPRWELSGCIMRGEKGRYFTVAIRHDCELEAFTGLLRDMADHLDRDARKYLGPEKRCKKAGKR